MPIPISETVIHQHASDKSVSRGESYYQRGAVVDVVQRGNTIAAAVEGSEVLPYRVNLQFDSGGVTAAQCTCPYDFGGWCKHIVATLLTCIRHPDQVEHRPPLEQLLAGLDAPQLQRLVQVLVAAYPELIDEVDRQVVMVATPHAPSQKVRRSSPLDITPFQRQARHIMREGVRSLEEGYEDDPFTDELQNLIDQALAFAHNGDGESAIGILTVITEACIDEWDDVCDYGGESFPITEYLNEAWAEVILSAELDAPDRVDLDVMLSEWEEALNANFAMSLAALHQGWDDPELQRVLQGHGYTDPERLDDPVGQPLAKIRLHILDRQDRQQEYLNLARTEGLMQEYLTRLAELGDVQTAMTVAEERMTTAEEAFALAKTLRESNHLAEALAIAQAGLQLPGQSGYALANWTSELAEGLGDATAALNASRVAFQLRPNFTDYQRLEHLAGQAWESLKPELLVLLRQAPKWDAYEAKVDIFLHENLIDDAINVVDGDRYHRSETLYRVTQAALKTHPDWVIATARKLAEPIMTDGKADRYDAAVRWLAQAKLAYVHAGRQSEWNAYFNQLQSIHSRKRKLMDLFKVLSRC